MPRPALILAALLLLLANACKSPPPFELDDLGPLPPWQFQDELGRSFGSDQLKGKPWVANFLFTSCPTSCPALRRFSLECTRPVVTGRRNGTP